MDRRMEGWRVGQTEKVGYKKTSTPSTPVGYQVGYKVGYIRGNLCIDKA